MNQDIRPLIQASLFSGMGGFDKAADWMNWETVFHCEWNPFGQHILKEHWPSAKTYEDITKSDFTIWRGRVDVLTGGFPCQPYSVAGKQKGKDDERHLWPEMRRAIREIQPTWVVGENVRGLIGWNAGLVFHEVQAELEIEGYEVLPFLLPACAVNAPHERYRTWFIARHRDHKSIFIPDTGMADIGHESPRQENAGNSKKNPTRGVASNASCGRSRGLRDKSEAQGSRRGNELSGIGSGLSREFNVADARHVELQRSEQHGSIESSGPVEANGRQSSRSVRPDWQEFPTQSPLCSGDDGFPTESLRQRIREDSLGYLDEKEIEQIISKARNEWRNETIKAGGNAIVPQVAFQIYQAIDQYERWLKSQQNFV